MNVQMRKSRAKSHSPTTNHEEAVMYDIENLGRMKNLAVHAPLAMKGT
jgi:hypothetical protein